VISKFYRAIYVVLITCVATWPIGATPASSPPALVKSKADLAGAWLGGAADAEFARLSLAPGGSGSLTIQ
jgi:hypothetical protein